MDNIMINIAADFSAYPAGRSDQDGPNNGTRFREEQLAPLLKKAIETGVHLVVSFDGLKVCGSSFLDSAFGGLVRNSGITNKEAAKHLELVAVAPQFERYLEAARRYIRAARSQ